MSIYDVDHEAMSGAVDEWDHGVEDDELVNRVPVEWKYQKDCLVYEINDLHISHGNGVEHVYHGRDHESWCVFIFASVTFPSHVGLYHAVVIHAYQCLALCDVGIWNVFQFLDVCGFLATLHRTNR